MTQSTGIHLNQGTRVGFYGAIAATLGVLTSGPIAMAVVAAIQPQPPWVDAWTFVENYHPIQSLPFLCGMLLVAGFVAIIASIHGTWGKNRLAVSSCALVCAAVFAALVGFNYVVQVGFVPALARDFKIVHAPLIAAFSMVRPGSLSWALELWGYAALGVATWLVAPFFAGPGLEAVARFAFAANGPLSLGAALGTVVRPGWEGTRTGFVAFVLWNVLALIMALSASVVFAWRLRGHGGRHAPDITTPETLSPF